MFCCVCMGVWVYGCMGVWVCGCVGVWVCGCVGVWVCGCVGVWVWVDEGVRGCVGMFCCVCVYGCMGVWVCGCVGVWVCGCVGVWVCGCVGVWVCGCVGERGREKEREGENVHLCTKKCVYACNYACVGPKKIPPAGIAWWPQHGSAQLALAPRHRGPRLGTAVRGPNVPEPGRPSALASACLRGKPICCWDITTSPALINCLMGRGDTWNRQARLGSPRMVPRGVVRSMPTSMGWCLGRSRKVRSLRTDRESRPTTRRPHLPKAEAKATRARRDKKREMPRKAW